MTSQNGPSPASLFYAAMAGSAIAGALIIGAAAPTGPAVPADQTAARDHRNPRSADDDGRRGTRHHPQQDYDTGAGGGQLSQLIHEVLVLRNLGFKAVEREQGGYPGGAGPPAEPGPGG